MIDLHTHTTASDGTLTPSELVSYAQKKNLAAVAITDHDTIEGVARAVEAAGKTGLEVVPGVEISARHAGGTLHILGYYIDITNTEFLGRLSVLQQARASRNPAIIHKLQSLGIKIDMEEVRDEAGTGQIGRPHFARLLVKKGYVRNPRQAFEKYLKKGAPAYREKFRFQPREAIEYILLAGGVPVLAHPVTLKAPSESALQKEVSAMAAQGLMGIEAYYPDHTAGQTARFIELARQFNLLVTGGTDFHGKNLSAIDLGRGRGNLSVPYELLEAIKAVRGKP